MLADLRSLLRDVGKLAVPLLGAGFVAGFLLRGCVPF